MENNNMAQARGPVPARQARAEQAASSERALELGSLPCFTGRCSTSDRPASVTKQHKDCARKMSVARVTFWRLRARHSDL